MTQDLSKIKDNAQLHDELEDIPLNTSGNRPFNEVLKSNMSRRSVMVGGLGAATTFLALQSLAGSWGWNKKETSLKQYASNLFTMRYLSHYPKS